jgi:hypothetical protein
MRYSVLSTEKKVGTWKRRSISIEDPGARVHELFMENSEISMKNKGIRPLPI